MSFQNGSGLSRLMKILLLVLGAACTIAVDAVYGSSLENSGFTNELSPWIRKLYDAFTWAVETNGIRFGARIASKANHPADQLQVFTCLGNTRSTNRSGLLIPPHGCCLDLSLRGLDGKEVPKTSAGKALCRPVPSALRSVAYFCTLVPGVPHQFDAPFDLRTCFRIKQPGIYILTLKPRLYDAKKPYPQYDRLDLPAAQIKVVLSEADLEPSQ